METIDKRLKWFRRGIVTFTGAIGVGLCLLDAPNVVSGWPSVAGLALLLGVLFVSA